jgi:hypothetical protein
MVDIVYEIIKPLGIVRTFTINGTAAKVEYFGEIDTFVPDMDENGVPVNIVRTFIPYCQTENILAAYNLTNDEYDEVCYYLKARIES